MTTDQDRKKWNFEEFKEYDKLHRIHYQNQNGLLGDPRFDRFKELADFYAPINSISMLIDLCEEKNKVIEKLQTENMRYFNALQEITENGHTDCEWCVVHDAQAQLALKDSSAGGGK